MRPLFLLLSLLTFSLFGLEPLQLLKTAEPDSWLLLRLQKQYILLHVLKKESNQLFLEEIMSQKPLKPGYLFDERAPAQSWLVHTIDLTTGEFLSTFSRLEQCEVTISERDNFLSALFHLSFEKIPNNERRRIGQPPEKGEFDRRKIWQPKLIFEGSKYPDVAFDGWKAHWPCDESELSNKVVIVYTPPKEGPWPSYFPYWLEVPGTLGQAKLQVIDSGRSYSKNSSY